MFLLIDKPKGITSHDVVDKLRKITGIKRIGHAGTLDPNATGLLIVAIGRDSTKKIDSILKSSKEYEAEIFLGKSTTTDDSEGEVVDNYEGSDPGISKIKKNLNKFKGNTLQIPPSFSSVKIKGKRAYKYARLGKEVEIKPRRVKIFSIKIKEYKYPIIALKLKVSSGTYIRAVARDLGKRLGTYGFLQNLRRIKIGEYDISNSVPLSKIDTVNWDKIGFEI